ncbi:MAG: radical SAM family heme chaperone HemW [Myxococcota bacterium]|nr:radical SAM family heme chaperone HemW [Myxococcota bacterium]
MTSVGVYVHVPFCERVCPYCDFAVVAARPLRSRDQTRYVAALRTELEARAAPYAERVLASLYLGGGTPSLLEPDAVAAIVDAVDAQFPESSGDCEVTLEVNPSTLERERLPGFRAAGVNRLSIGVQSFDDEVLRRLGRAHRAGEARATLRAARDAGFENLSLDLIFAAPGGSRDQLARDLDEVVSFGPEHVSTYELTIEPGTPFALAQARGQLARAGEDETIAALERIESVLGAAGLVRYEISSHARAGFESRHTRRYWRREPVLGLGMSAWSSLVATPEAPHGGRVSNPRSLAAYLEAVEAGDPSAGSSELHDAATARCEAMFLGLRQREGIRARAFEAEFGAPPRAFFGQQIETMCDQGLLEERDRGDLRLSPRGWLLADTVASYFV